MKVVIVGGGGREHALGWKIKQSPLVTEVIGVPGNAGWHSLGPCWTDIDDLNATLPARCREESVGLVVVGPEAPLVDGLADLLRTSGIPVFGPGADGAVFEGSKIASKEFMARHDIRTAAFGVFDDPAEARAYIQQQGAPIVVKADGLAAGKGVIVAATEQEAFDAVTAIMEESAFGEAGARVVIEACLEGEEVSVIAITDGKTIVPFLPSQDHKRIFDGDRGPNTGGMGAYVPTSVVDDALWKRIQEEVVDRTLAGFCSEGIDFCGVVYSGIMIQDGDPYVLEYNVRFGDPECQPLLFHMQSDLVPYLLACAEGTLAQQPPITWHDGTTLCVVLASEGYPAGATKGVPIPNLDAVDTGDGFIFHAGTAVHEDKIVTNGGRVLGITARGADVPTAQQVAYGLAEQVAWPGCQYRRDIGWREAERQQVEASC